MDGIIFDSPGVFVRQRGFCLQKVRLEDYERTRDIFTYVLEKYRQEESGFGVLGRFYELLGQLFPLLRMEKREKMDERIEAAVHYLEAHYQESLSVKKLAQISHMSESRFFPNFKKATGVTPVERPSAEKWDLNLRPISAKCLKRSQEKIPGSIAALLWRFSERIGENGQPGCDKSKNDKQ